jgi:hypothetical protein
MDLENMGYNNPAKGADLITSGDKITLAVGNYYGRMYSRACDTIIYGMYYLAGRIECATDANANADCVLDGENKMRIVWMRGSGGGDMIFNSLHFKNGNSVTSGGGIMISPRFGDTVQTRVIIEFCVFSNNQVQEGGGGAIFIDALGTSDLAKLWLYAVNFYDNQDVDWAKDLYTSNSEVTISADCPLGYEGKPKVEVDLQVGESSSTLNGLEKGYSKGTCNKCVEGKYLMNTGSAENDICVSCEFGKYNEFERATDSGSCSSCPVGKTNFVEGAAASEACTDDSTHVFNFMGCSNGVPTADGTTGSELKASAIGAVCTPEGMTFDGIDDYVDITPWEFGGAISIEMYVRYWETLPNARVLEFDTIAVGNKGITDCILFNVETKEMDTADIASWNQAIFDPTSGWSHVVVTTEAVGTVNVGKIYKDSVLAKTTNDFQEPTVRSRFHHWLGRGTGNGVAEDDWFFRGTIAYVKIWHNKALTQEEVNALPSIPCVPGKYGPGYPNCVSCPFGTYNPASGAEACTPCPEGTTSFTTGSISQTSCIAGIHTWNFMGCKDGQPVVDETEGSTLAATISSEGATCSPEGTELNGETGQITLDSWEWGGTTTFEVFVKVQSVPGVIFNFAQGNSYVTLKALDDWTIEFAEKYGSTEQVVTSSSTFPWNAGVWNHVIVQIDGDAGSESPHMTIYKNGEVAGSKVIIGNPGVATREQSTLGNFQGTLAWFKVWHNKALVKAEIDAFPIIPCAPGSYGSGLPECVVCPSGSYATTGGSSACQACPIGTFNADYGTSATYHDDIGDCTVCGEGKYNDDDGEVSNDFSKHGPGTCKVCDTGKYNDDDGDIASNHAECTKCPAGRYNEFGGMEALKNNGIDDCQLCISGRYAPDEGQSECVECPAGTSSAPGASVCGSCPAGYICPDDGVAQACAEGYYTDGTQTACQPCSKGYRCPGGMNRQLCSAGSFQSQNGQWSCEECEAGKYQNLLGQEECLTCPEGHFCPKSSTNPIKCGSVVLYCPSGSISPLGVGSGNYSIPNNEEMAIERSAQKECEVGYECVAGVKSRCSGVGYSDESGLSACKSAPAGYKPNQNNDGVEACPRGRFSNGGMAECSQCAQGKFSLVKGAKACTTASTCPPGTKVLLSSNSTHDTTCGKCGKGEVSMGGSGTSCFSCLGSGGEYADEEGLSACRIAPPGYSVTEDRTNITMCASGKYSSGGQTLCSKCEQGKYSSAGSVGCTPCDPGEVPDGELCVPCNSGQYASFGSWQCLSCPDGFFSSKPKSGYCEPCPEGTYTRDHKECVKCPAGKISGVAQERCTDCEIGKVRESTARGDDGKRIFG